MTPLPDINQFAVTPSVPDINQFAAVPTPAAPPAPTRAAPQPNQFMTAARGLTYGLTAGAAKPLASYAMVGLDKLIGEGKLTRQEALQLLEEQRAEDIAASPITYGAGQVVGGLGLGSRLAALKGGTTIPGAIGYGGAAGAVSGYSETEKAIDAVTGAVLGGALQGTASALAGGVKMGAEAFGKQWVTKTAKDIDDQVAKEMKDVAKERLLTTGKRMTPQEIKNEGLARKIQLAEQYTLSNIFKLTGQRALEEAKTGVPIAIGGAAAGSLGALASGQNPLAGAALGAGGALAATKANVLGDVTTGASRFAGKYFANPMRTASFAELAERGAGGLAQTAAQPLIQQQADQRSRLQTLADDFRAKYGGQ